MAQTGSNGWFQPDSVFGANRRSMWRGGSCDQMCNPDAIMTHVVSVLSLCFSSVRVSRTFSIWDPTSKLHNITENGQTPDTIASRHPAWLCRCVGLWYGLPHDLAFTGPQAGPSKDFS
jgi:hypothetical protein